MSQRALVSRLCHYRKDTGGPESASAARHALTNRFGNSSAAISPTLGLLDMATALTCGLVNTARNKISIPSAHILHLARQRGRLGSSQVVVVVANFSDFSTPPGPSPEYVVHNWPADPSGPEMAGGQPAARRPTGMDQPRTIFDRETKIYTLL